MYELKDKVAIVTGAASGIGFSTAKAFLEKGAKVLISDVDAEKGEQALESLKNFGEVRFFPADVSDEDDVKAMIDETVSAFGRLDILFNNAGIADIQPTEGLSKEQYKKVIAVNQDSIFYGAKHAVKHMRKVGGGTIINNASILGTVGQTGALSYNASKGAVNLMTKSLALEFAEENIRVNAVCPGYVETGMVNKEALGDFYDQLTAQHPVKRLGVPEEIAHAVIFLAENTFTTGLSLLVDGGYTAQ